MTVSNISSFAAGVSRVLNSQTARVANSLQAIAPASNIPDAANVDLTNEVQNQVQSLRSTAQSLAQAAAQNSVAINATDQIIADLDQLQQLSLQATGNISDEDRQTLNNQFQSLRAQIDTIAKNSQFAGQKLLDGSQGSVSNLTDQNIFGSADMNLQTAQNAAAALQAVKTAQTYIAGQISTINTIGESLQFAVASVNSAIQNQEASRSELSDADLTQTATDTSFTKLQAQATEALLAQTNKLSPSALTLLVE